VGFVRLFLCSAGINNRTIQNALVGLLGKPIAESHALCIPTAGYGTSYGPVGPWRFLTGRSVPMVGLGWKSVVVLELTALPSIDRKRWVRWVREADVLLVNGGNTMYLNRWMRESGLAGLLPSLPETVYVGSSAGSMVLTPRIGRHFADGESPADDDRTLGMVDFSIFPHLDHPDLPHQSMAAAERWAAEIAGPAYAIDDNTAVKVVDGTVEVVSEGRWKLFDPAF
jgi:dipeptidase E